MSTTTPGRWPVVLSNRARGELRLLAEDKNTLDIVRKKIKELSHGQFTTTNQIPVRGSTQYIPIYRARLSNDLRIIYRIDLESDGFNNYDQQIIRILAVSSRARVAYDFWLKVSKFLRRRGPEYRKRCIRRDTLETKDGPLCVPASFPHKTYNSLTEPDPELEDADLLLEKYIPVTKSLYNSILADMDSVLPIILNPDEKAIVRYQGTSVVIGRSGTGKTTALVYKMRANALTAESSDRVGSSRQLFVTRSPVLTRRVGSYYKGLIDSSEMAHKSPEELQMMRQSNQNDQPRDILELDNEADLRDDLPARYSELSDEHFPLFISFDRLSQLLEADALRTDDALVLARNRHKRLINFSTFKYHYWSKFDYNLTRKLDPALVFSEILGVIKGYGQDLTEDEYLNGLTSKKSPLLANVRSEVYAIFKAYKERCSVRGETDAADRVRTILSARNDGAILGPWVGHLFVDEVQDQLMADIYLLHSLCSNINGGYWCGDTAQTINVGSSFRIRDMKAYIYEKMVSDSTFVHDGFQRKIAAPFSTFELTVNFRSHHGIVKYAASLVQLLYTLFPGSIDHMQAESAPIPGPKPLLFISPSWGEDLFSECLLDRMPADQCPPFGPEQAIIVRSEETARSLKTKLQNRCNVLTLLESKGLEFDDLILYGFFTESDVSSSAWRSIAMLETHEEDGVLRFSKPSGLTLVPPSLCSELKQLYVAVTRARHRCWLWDSGAVVEMMGKFWQSLGLIKISDSIDSLSLFAEAADDPRRWAQRAEGFFSNGLYSIAQTCFERAGREKEAQIADAYNHMSEAGKLLEDTLATKSAYLTAAEKMIACTQLHSTHSTATLWYHAATCLEAAKEISRASQAYSEGKFYDRAVLVYFDAQDMNGCLQVIQSYSQHINQALLQRIKEVASVHFLRQHDYRRLKSLHNGDFGRCIEVAQSLRFKEQLKELLKMAQRFEDLAIEYLGDGLPVEAVNCLVHCLRTPSAIQQSRDIISIYLWANFGLNDISGNKVSNQANLLVKIYNSNDDLYNHEGLQDIKVFEAILCEGQLSLDTFYELVRHLDEASEGYIPRVIILQHHALKRNDWDSCSSHANLLAYLKIWSAYNARLQQLKSLKFPSQDLGIRRLLGLSSPTTTTSEVIIPEGSTLHEITTKSHGNRPREKAAQVGTTVSSRTADMYIQTSFANRVKRELITLSSNLLRSRRIQVALPSQSDSDVPTTCGSSFEGAIELILCILPTLGSAMDQERNSDASAFTSGDEEKIRVAWSIRIFSVVYSLSGSIGDLNNALYCSHSDSGSASIYAWLAQTLQALDPLEPTFTTLFVACAAIISELLTNDGSFLTVPPLKLKKTPRPSMLRGRPQELERFAGDTAAFFQRDSPWRIVNMNRILQRMLRQSWLTDISVMVQLIEQATREIIVAERAAVSWLFGGFSGLIVPRSWAINLVKHSARAENAYVLKPNAFADFLSCIREVLFRISNGIPDHWNVLTTREGGRRAQSGMVALRLLWSIMIVIVNIHPSHESTSFVLNILNQIITRMFSHQDSFAEGVKALGLSISRLPKVITQQSCLGVLLQIYTPEDMVMLQARSANTRSDARLLNGKIIPFDTLDDLRNALSHHPQPHRTSRVTELNTRSILESELNKAKVAPNEIKTNLSTVASEENPEPQSNGARPTHDQEALLVTAPLRPDTPTSMADSENNLEDRDNEPCLLPEEAALCVFGAWRRSKKRAEQRLRLFDFDQGGQVFEQYHQYFPKIGVKTPERDKLGLKLIRGPGVNIVLGLRSLVDEIDLYMETLEEEIKAPGLTPAELVRTQESIKERKKKAEGYKDRIFTCCPPDSPPKLLIAKNLAGVKSQTKLAWDAFMLVKNSQVLQGSSKFREIEAMVSSGRNVVLDATKRSR